MAKGNLFLGKARGRVGSVVFSNLNGEQVTRSYQSSVKNPRTDAQVIQRAMFATCTVGASNLYDVVDHSFDGIKNGSASRNEFIKTNLAYMRSNYEEKGTAWLDTYILPKGAKYIKPFNWIVSRGTLGDYTPESFDYLIPDGTTKGEILGLFPWLQPGAQLSFIAIAQIINQETGVISYRVEKSRIVFNSLLANYTNEDPIFLGGFIRPIVDVEKCENVKFQQASGSDDVEEIVLPEFCLADGATMTFESRTGWIWAAYTLVGTVYDSRRSDPYRHTTSQMAVNTDAWDDTNENIATYGNTMRKTVESPDYLDQAEPRGEEPQSYTLEELVSGTVQAPGMKTKSIYLAGTNSYGPVAEGARVTFAFNIPSGWIIPYGTIRVSNGETPLSGAQITRLNNGTLLIISAEMPQTASFQANISFDVVYKETEDVIGRAAIRCNISKAN